MVAIEGISSHDHGTVPGGAPPLGQVRADVSRRPPDAGPLGPNNYAIHGSGGGGSDEAANENQELQQSYESLGSPIEHKPSEPGEANENLDETNNSVETCASNDPYGGRKTCKSESLDVTNDSTKTCVSSDPYGDHTATTHDDRTTDGPSSASRLDTTDGSFSTPVSEGATRFGHEEGSGATKSGEAAVDVTGVSVASTLIYDSTVAQHLECSDNEGRAEKQSMPQGSQPVTLGPTSSASQ